MTISSSAWQAIAVRETTEAFLLLMTVTPSGQPPIRMVNNTSDVVSRGNTFIAYPFTIDLPSNEEGQISSARIVLDNVSRTLVDEIRALASPLQVLLEVVLSSAPDTVEASFPDFTLRNVTYNALTIEGTLTLEDFLSEPYPKDILSGASFPGLF